MSRPDDAEIRARLTAIFREVFDDDAMTISDEMTAADVESWDSFNHIDLIVAIESSFDVRFTTSEVANLANVGQLIGLLENKLPGPG